MTYLLQPDGKVFDVATDLEVGAPALILHKMIDVPHLAPHVMTVTMPKGDLVKIRVAYSCHCFTEGHDLETPQDDQVVIMDGLRPRVFDQRRYDLSRTLPTLIAGLSDHKVYMLPPMPRREPNFTAFDAQVELEDGLVYRMFFVLRGKSGREGKVRYRLELFVESAYPTTKEFKGMRIKFVTLVDATLRGKTIKYNP